MKKSNETYFSDILVDFSIKNRILHISVNSTLIYKGRQFKSSRIIFDFSTRQFIRILRFIREKNLLIHTFNSIQQDIKVLESFSFIKEDANGPYVDNKRMLLLFYIFYFIDLGSACDNVTYGILRLRLKADISLFNPTTHKIFKKLSKFKQFVLFIALIENRFDQSIK